MTPKTETLTPFERDLLEAVRQAKAGEAARVHTPEQIVARRKVGRPAGTGDNYFITVGLCTFGKLEKFIWGAVS